MPADALDRSEVEDRLWKEVEDAHLGMLGLVGGEPRHFKPMTPYVERPADRLWFFTKRNVDLVKGIGAGGGEGLFLVLAKDGKFQASLAGRLSEDFSVERRDRYWNPMAAAWFPDGKDDPELTMLRLDLADAEVWHSEAGLVRMAWETAKANVTRKMPDIGDKTELKF